MDMPNRPILQADDILQAYRLGYFPMAESRDDPNVFWVHPQKRGVLPLNGLKVSRSLKKVVRRNEFVVKINTAFSDVMRCCAAETPDRDETWINDRIIEVYSDLHHQGHAHSVECWHGTQLAGGLYGVSIGGAFFGESMFSRRTNASKVALVHLIARMKAGGYRLLDTQFITDHLISLGAEEITKSEYQNRLNKALETEGDILKIPYPSDGSTILQSITQTS